MPTEEGAEQNPNQPPAGEGAPDSQNQNGGAAGGEGSPNGGEVDVFAGLEADNREWLTKQGYVADGKPDLAKLGKQVYQQEKLLGNAIRIPGKDATPEERNAFLEKLGRPATADAYEFQVPKDLPEELPYDGEGAKEYGAKAHELGLTKAQANGLHDWWASKQVGLVKQIAADKAAEQIELAKKSAEGLVKRWGPLDGETAKANLQFADKVLGEAEPGFIEEMQARGMIGPNKEVLSEGLAVLFAKVGTALYKEGDTLRGNGATVGNPFADGEGFNMTEQMRVAKNDPDLAYSLVTAAGKKPEDFGLKAR